MIYLLKVIALGSARAIVLPASLLSDLDIDRGDILAVRSDRSGCYGLERANPALFEGKPPQSLRAAEDQRDGLVR
jgi:bifunctional DNA-binding transcriptional regulator/antitoxin component of YhaV-PrlF toxin-antitoxin module